MKKQKIEKLSFEQELHILTKKHKVRLEGNVLFPKYNGTEIPDLLKVALFIMELHGAQYGMKIIEEKK